MSHNVLVKDVHIKDLNALRAAVQNLARNGVNIELDEKSGRFRSYTGTSECDLTVKYLNGRQDVGLVKNEDGTYSPLYDVSMIGPDLRSAVAPDGHADYGSLQIGKLLQEYSACVIEREAAFSGLTTTRELDPKSGAVYVTVEGY